MMSRRTLAPRQVLAEPERPMRVVYFPVEAVISLFTTMSDGSAMETAMVGREGMVGISVFLGDSAVGNTSAVTQIPGEVLSLASQELESAVAAFPNLGTALRAYANALLFQQAQAVGCARLHSLNRRLSTLLLRTQDEAGMDEFPLTQQAMSSMLGVHRPSVTLAARGLLGSGFIRYRRGIVTILNRDGLANAACECYGMIRSALRRLIGAPIGGRPFQPVDSLRSLHLPY
jgi:CRP-like cAMP-binding protein